VHQLSGKAFGLAKDHLLRSSTRLETITESNARAAHREPWNKGKIVGQKAPFKLCITQEPFDISQLGHAVPPNRW